MCDLFFRLFAWGVALLTSPGPYEPVWAFRGSLGLLGYQKLSITTAGGPQGALGASQERQEAPGAPQLWLWIVSGS
jgi:hypothetical protein